MTDQITASSETLMRQAWMTATEYMVKAVQEIDELLGEGYAKEHPELIGAFMQTAAMDFAGGIIAQQIRAGLDDITGRGLMRQG